MTRRQENDMLAEVATEQLRAQKEKYVIPLLMDLSIALSVVAALQLASRHPGNVGPTAKVTRDVVSQIISRVRGNGYLSTAQLMELGNDPANDLPS